MLTYGVLCTVTTRLRSHWRLHCMLLFIASRASSNYEHDMGALLLNAETIKGVPTPIFSRLVRCPANGHLFTRLQYDIYLHLQRQTPPGEMPDQYQVHAETIDSGDSFPYCTDVIQATPDSDGKVFIQLNAMSCRRHYSSSLEPHRKYRTIITAKNEAGESNSTGDIHFSKRV